RGHIGRVHFFEPVHQSVPEPGLGCIFVCSLSMYFLRAFCLCQCRLKAFVTLASHVRSLTSSISSDGVKNLMPFGGGLPGGLSRRAATRIGTSCGWHLITHADCQAA